VLADLRFFVIRRMVFCDDIKRLVSINKKMRAKAKAIVRARQTAVPFLGEFCRPFIVAGHVAPPVN